MTQLHVSLVVKAYGYSFRRVTIGHGLLAVTALRTPIPHHGHHVLSQLASRVWGSQCNDTSDHKTPQMRRNIGTGFESQCI